ncbi:unnamed protein product [Allacma fusca]|uniref:Uncharacterized protein n=1 Tax=Allacma fusca TaxID=39272 RepID=A0A8J2LCY5_9HEXA|nr:unnamed protein product [Allacma fusca]
MLPTNVVSFMKKMVSNTEGVNANQFGGTSNSSGAGAIGRLRQTLQQAQETVSNRLQAAKPQQAPGYQNQQQYQQPETPTQDVQQNVIPASEEKENTESPRPGSAGRCRVCVKAMKPDEYSRECTECGLKVCDDCASYSNNAEGNEVWSSRQF